MLPLLSTKEITVVFANIEDLLLTNTVWLSRTHSSSRSDDCFQGFVSSLEERQKDCRLYVDRIGDILFNHLPNMGVYMVRHFERFGPSQLTETDQEYCVNQGTAIKVLQSLRDSNPELAQHLQVSLLQLRLTGR